MGRRKVGRSDRADGHQSRNLAERWDPTNAPLEEFVKQLAKLSGGSLKVEALYDHEEDKGGDGAVITDLRNGAVDIAIVPARAWSEAGATSISALQTPFLIKSDEHLNAVASDGKVSGNLLASLSTLGVTGLALYPEALRHLFGFKSQPILTPADLAGRQVDAALTLPIPQR